MSLFSHAMSFLQRRTSRTRATDQPDSRRRRERALRAASSLDLGSKSDLELESSSIGHQAACNTQQVAAEESSRNALQANMAEDADLAPTLISQAPTLQLDVRNNRTRATDQPDSRRRRERALRAASSLDLGGSKSDLEIESSSPGHQTACNTQHIAAEENSCHAMQANMAEDADLAPTLVSQATALELVAHSNLSANESRANESQPKHFFAVAERARAEALIREDVMQQTSLSVPCSISEPTLDHKTSKGQMWEATFGQQNMAPEVVRAKLTECESAILEEKGEDVIAEKSYSEGINGEAVGEHTSPAVPLSASPASGNMREARSGHLGMSQHATQAEPRSPEQAIVGEQSEDVIAQKAILELSMHKDVPVQDSLPALPPIPDIDLNPEPPRGHEWEATLGHHKMAQDSANVEGTEPESSILAEKCEDAETSDSDAKTFSGDAAPEHASSLVPSPASELVLSHTPPSGHEMRIMSGHAQMTHGHVQAEPKRSEPTTAEEQCEDVILQKAHIEVSIDEATPVQSSLPVSPLVSELALPEPCNGDEGEATSQRQWLAVQDVVNTEPPEREPIVVEEKCEGMLVWSADAEAFMGEATRDHTFSPIPIPSLVTESASNHLPCSGNQREATSGQPRVAQDASQSEPTNPELNIVQQEGEKMTQKAHSEVFMEALPVQTSLSVSSPVSAFVENPELPHGEARTGWPNRAQDDVNAEPTVPELSIAEEKGEGAEAENEEAFDDIAMCEQQASLPVPSPVLEVASNPEPSSRRELQVTSSDPGMAQNNVQAEPRRSEPAIMKTKCADIIAQHAHADVSIGEPVPVQPPPAVSAPVLGLDLKLESSTGRERGQHNVAQYDVQAKPTESRSVVEKETCNGIPAEDAHAEAFSFEDTREQAFFLMPSTLSALASNHGPSSSNERETTASRAQDDEKGELTEIGPDAMKEKNDDAEQAQGKKRPRDHDTGDCLEEALGANQLFSRVRCHRDKRWERSLRAASSLGPSSSAKLEVSSPCRTESDFDQDDDNESTTGGNQDILSGEVASQVYTEVVTLLHNESQEDLTVAALTSDPSQADSRERPMLEAVAVDPCRPDDQIDQTLRVVAATRSHPPTGIQFIDPDVMIPAAVESDLGQASQTATIARLDNQEGSTPAITSLHREGLIPEPSLVKESILRTSADAATESLDEEIAESTEDEAESDEDCVQQTPNFQPHVEVSEQEVKEFLEKPVQYVQEQEGDELEADEKQEEGNESDEQQEVKENTGVEPQVVDGQEERRSQLEPSIPRAPPIVSLPRSNPQGNNHDGMMSTPMLDPAGAAPALGGSAQVQTAEVNIASHVSPARTPIRVSAVHKTACDKLQMFPPKLMQTANAKRRLVGKQSPEEHPRKLRKQLVIHPPLRSGSEIVRSSLGHSLRPSEQGCTVRVRGDGWGSLDGGYMATVTEADELSFTVIRQGGHWEETHVLREYCVLSPHPELQPECGYLSKSPSQAQRQRK